MNRGKPLFIKTYGKQRRKLSAWISPDTRKKAFESTVSSESDISIFEPAKPTAVRARRTSVASRRAVRPAKRKAMVCLKEDSDENSYISSPSLLATQWNKPARKSKLLPTPAGLLRHKAEQVLNTSKSEEDSTSAPKRRKITVRVKRNSDVYLHSVGHFITHRRGAVASKPKFPEACVVLNSSDDFDAGGGASGSRRVSRRRPPPMVSSAEKYVNGAGTASTPTNPILREISFNESADHSLAPCPRKPLFCSTPSAFPPNKQPRRKPLPINHQSSNALSISVSRIGFLSTSQEDLDSPGQTFSPPYSAPLSELSSREKHQSTLDEPQKESSDSELAKSHNNATETQNSGELSSQKLLSLVSTETEGSSHFVSAVDGLEWLVEALKENCLTQHCTVQLERLDKLTVNLLHSQTTYSSSLDHSRSVHSRQTHEHPLSVEGSQATDHSQSLEPSVHLVLSVDSNETYNYLQSVNISDSSNDASSVTDSQITNLSQSLDCKQSEARMAKCLTKKCTVQLKTVAESQLTVIPQLQEFTRCSESGVASDGNSVNPEEKKSEGDHTLNSDHSDDHIHSRKTAKTKMVSDTQSVYNSRSDQAQSIDPGTEERAAALTATLRGKCLIEKVAVKVKRATLSKWKGTLQLDNTTHKSPTDVSTSASDGQSVRTWLGNDHESEADHTANTDHRNHHTRPIKVGKKKRGSTNSEDKIASDNEDILRNPHGILHKRKKASLAPKEKRRSSVSRDRSGTTRKACVSGLSVSRWKNKGNTSAHISQSRAAQRGGSKAMDWSISELLSTHHKQPKLQGTSVIFSTPVKANRLNLSSLLADLTPDTHTWSRLKAALSVHRKTKVLLTPRSLPPPMPGSPGGVGLADASQDLFATPLQTPLPKCFQAQLLRSASVIVCEDADLSDAEKVYAECGQQGALPWEECILPQRMKRCVKIGEGTFGEVFSTTNASGDTVALKIIPVEGSEKVNGEDQKTFGEILHEIIISKELSSLKEKQQNQTNGFIGLMDLHCARGCYPPAFLDAWDAFDQQKGSENDRPDFFEKEQLFLILEFEFGGSDLENTNGTLSSLVVAKSILHQVTAALAVAEQELHFEHRDLHWGNVLVKTTKQKKGNFLLNGTTHSLDTKGVLVRIIDYSLSRLEIDGLTVSCDISEDEELFMGQGDYQFDIYRLMRQENSNNWSNYQPHSNVLWLHYLCSKLLSMKYRGTGGRGTKDMRQELTHFHDNLLQYRSAIEVLQNCPMFQ